MPDQLTIQVFACGQWHNALQLTVENPGHIKASACTSAYLSDYVVGFLDEIDSFLEPAVSVNLPVNWAITHSQGLPAFLYDILPAGSARRSLERRFAGERPEGMDLDFFLLKRCAPAPVGHLRVRESAERLDAGQPIAFAREEIVRRTNDFLEYAYELGAAMGGATGAQGEAPKLLMSEDANGGFHADATLPDHLVQRHWLVKFARNQATEQDQDILRAEFHYYRAVAELGLDTVAIDGLTLEESERPSLWMPRFDRRKNPDGRVERIPMESIYSICGNTQPGSAMRHEAVVQRLIELWHANHQRDEIGELIVEYIRRDLLNRILGNSDNHGRNMSILRHAGRLQLAPIYDLAPMVLDPEGITRVTKWQCERLGAPDWHAVCALFAEYIAPEHLLARLRAAAEQFRALPGLLTEVPASIRRAPSIPVNNLDTRLREWGLL